MGWHPPGLPKIERCGPHSIARFEKCLAVKPRKPADSAGAALPAAKRHPRRQEEGRLVRQIGS